MSFTEQRDSVSRRRDRVRAAKRVLRRALSEVLSHKDAAHEIGVKPNHLSKALDEDSLEQLGVGDCIGLPQAALVVVARWFADAVDCDLVPRTKITGFDGKLRSLQRLLKETADVVDAMVASGVGDPDSGAKPSPAHGSRIAKESDEAIEVLHHVRRFGLSGVECARTLRRAS